MANNCKELFVVGDSCSPEFIQDLFPSAERTALFYHLSFLCLGGFPQLERLIRERAIETQLLFGSSEAVLLKCVGTSSNLVTSLFPILKKAVETNKPVLAVRFLEKAKKWIDDIIRAVDDMVTRYDQQNQSVSTCTSDVFQKQKDTNEILMQHSDEMKALGDALAKFEEDMRETLNKIEKNEKKTEETTSELQDLIRRHKEKEKQRSFFSKLFVGVPLVSHQPDVVAKKGELTRLDSEKKSLRKIEWEIKIKQTDLQLKMATSKIRMGAIPSPVHLTEVQQNLFQIQQILVDLKKFWEKVGVSLDTLKDKTFVGEELVDLEDMKTEFLASIEEAETFWERFGACSQRAQGVFSVQSKDAYKFLAINPFSLTEEERDEQYLSVMEKLKKINPYGSSTAAITE